MDERRLEEGERHCLSWRFERGRRVVDAFLNKIGLSFVAVHNLALSQ